MKADVDDVAERVESYLQTLLLGNRDAASKQVDSALKAGLRPLQVQQQILAPAQVRVGEMWHNNEINVAQEHIATEITRELLTRIRDKQQPRNNLGLHVVLTTSEGERHSLGAQMAGNLLFEEGWQVHFLGPETPADDLVAFLKQTGAALVGLSVTTASGLPALEHTLTQIRAMTSPPKIMLGGYLAIHQPEVLAHLNADALVRNPHKLGDIVRSLFEIPERTLTLNQFLKELGSNIQRLRKQRRWSQQRLAESASLDRTYISAVEHGKQNLTLGAVVKLADALDVPVKSLLNGNLRELSE